MKGAKVIIIAVFGLSMAACRPAIIPPSATITNPLVKEQWELAMDSAWHAEKAGDKQEKAEEARQGLSYSESCIMRTPEEAACYYYRAINTGLYYEAHVIGYREGLSTMISDCNKVIELNEKFDHGGAYRILGKIYMEVPETTLVKNGVTRDIGKAVEYLKRAVQLDPNYPENYIYLTEALLLTGKLDEARKSFANSSTLVPQWKNHRDYAMWLKENKELSSKLKP